MIVLIKYVNEGSLFFDTKYVMCAGYNVDEKALVLQYENVKEPAIIREKDVKGICAICSSYYIANDNKTLYEIYIEIFKEKTNGLCEIEEVKNYL